ncbi:MAG: carbohydrate kinase family protein [Armatimonadetes bacterium]|nr:carbohydrate kinase family protein [Armatimonadota bacterium]
MEKDLDVLAVGEVNVDLIMSGLCRLPEWGTEVLAGHMELRLGGSTANFACACAALGLKVELVAWVGRDAFGDFLLRELDHYGVGRRWVRQAEDRSTGLTVSLSGKNDRAFVTSLGTIDYLKAQDVPQEAVAAARHVHVGSFFLQTALQPGLAELFQQARAAGATTSLDAGYDPSEKWDGGLRQVLPYVDLFFPNEVEACASTGSTRPEAAAETLASLGPLVVVKRGAQGCCAHDGCTFYQAPAYRVPVADTTACGDAFNAGFLWAWMNGKSVPEALKFGNAAGALAATVGGNDPTVLSPAALEAFLAT